MKKKFRLSSAFLNLFKNKESESEPTSSEVKDKQYPEYDHSAQSVSASTGVNQEKLDKKVNNVFNSFSKKSYDTISKKVEFLENSFSKRELALITLGAYNGQLLLQETLNKLGEKVDLEKLFKDLDKDSVREDDNCDCPACTLRRELEKDLKEGKKVIPISGPMGKA